MSPPLDDEVVGDQTLRVKAESGTEEIEITPQMIKAGATCLWGYDDQSDSAQAKAVEIFQEMMRERDRGRPR